MPSKPTPASPGLPPPTSTPSFWLDPIDPFLKSHRTTPDLPSTADIVIIGSGISGTMSALYIYDHFMRAEGKMPRVVMLESREVCFGATGRNGGNCKPAYYAYSDFEVLSAELGVDETVKIIDFQVKNLELLREIIRQNDISCDFINTTAVDAFFSTEAFNVAKASIKHLEAASSRLANLLEIHEPDSPTFKDYRVPGAKGIITYPAATLWPYKLISHILTKLIQDCGLNLQTNTSALRVSPATTSSSKHRVEISTTTGTIRCTDVIVAANAYTSHLLPAFENKIIPVRGHCSALYPPRSMDAQHHPLEHSYALVQRDRKRAEYLIQRSDGMLIIGGGRWLQKDNGLNCADDSTTEPFVTSYLSSVIGRVFTSETEFLKPTPPTDPEPLTSYNYRKHRTPSTTTPTPAPTQKDSPSDDVWQRVDHALNGPSWAFTTTPSTLPLTPSHEWTGIMGFSSDTRPWVGRVPSSPGIWLIAGMEGHGMAYATGCAAALVDMMVPGWEAGKEEGKRGKGMNHGLWFPESFRCTGRRLEAAPVGTAEERKERGGRVVEGMRALGLEGSEELVTTEPESEEEGGGSVFEDLTDVLKDTDDEEEDWIVV